MVVLKTSHIRQNFFGMVKTKRKQRIWKSIKALKKKIIKRNNSIVKDEEEDKVADYESIDSGDEDSIQLRKIADIDLDDDKDDISDDDIAAVLKIIKERVKKRRAEKKSEAVKVRQSPLIFEEKYDTDDDTGASDDKLRREEITCSLNKMLCGTEDPDTASVTEADKDKDSHEDASNVSSDESSQSSFTDCSRSHPVIPIEVTLSTDIQDQWSRSQGSQVTASGDELSLESTTPSFSRMSSINPPSSTRSARSFSSSEVESSQNSEGCLLITIPELDDPLVHGTETEAQTDRVEVSMNLNAPSLYQPDSTVELLPEDDIPAPEVSSVTDDLESVHSNEHELQSKDGNLESSSQTQDMINVDNADGVSFVKVTDCANVFKVAECVFDSSEVATFVLNEEVASKHSEDLEVLGVATDDESSHRNSVDQTAGNETVDNQTADKEAADNESTTNETADCQDGEQTEPQPATRSANEKLNLLGLGISLPKKWTTRKKKIVEEPDEGSTTSEDTSTETVESNDDRDATLSTIQESYHVTDEGLEIELEDEVNNDHQSVSSDEQSEHSTVASVDEDLLNTAVQFARDYPGIVESLMLVKSVSRDYSQALSWASTKEACMGMEHVALDDCSDEDESSADDTAGAEQQEVLLD